MQRMQQSHTCRSTAHLHKDILDLICALLVAKFRFQNHREDGNDAAEVGVAFTEDVRMVRLDQTVRPNTHKTLVSHMARMMIHVGSPEARDRQRHVIARGT